MRKDRGFTLLEILIVITIMSVIATIAIPSLLHAMDRSRQGSTVADLRVIGDAMERYAVENQTYPVVDEFAALRPELEPDYLKKLPKADGWDHPFDLAVDKKGLSYTLRSFGKDGEPQSAELTEVSHDFAADIVLVDGVFVQRPAGKQSAGGEKEGEEKEEEAS